MLVQHRRVFYCLLILNELQQFFCGPFLGKYITLSMHSVVFVHWFVVNSVEFAVGQKWFPSPIDESELRFPVKGDMAIY